MEVKIGAGRFVGRNKVVSVNDCVKWVILFRDSKRGFDLSIPLGGPDRVLWTSTASNGVLPLLPVHHCKAAVELRGQLHSFVDIDYTFHRDSGGDECRRSLETRGL